MAITEDDYNKFIDQFEEIIGKHHSVLKDKERFIKELSQNDEFIQENNKMDKDGAYLRILAQDKPEKFQLEQFKTYLKELNQFVEKWKTVPVSSWLFIDSAENFKEAAEWLFDEHEKYQVIRVYPWTTKREIKKEFDKIRETQPQIKLRADLYARNFKIQALHDAGWKWTEITKFLQPESDQQVNNKMDKREEELKTMGKTEGEIEKIIEDEFPYSDFDETLENLSNYDATRKGDEAAGDICEKFIQFFEIGK